MTLEKTIILQNLKRDIKPQKTILTSTEANSLYISESAVKRILNHWKTPPREKVLIISNHESIIHPYKTIQRVSRKLKNVYEIKEVNEKFIYESIVAYVFYKFTEIFQKDSMKPSRLRSMLRTKIKPKKAGLLDICQNLEHLLKEGRQDKDYIYLNSFLTELSKKHGNKN